MHNKKLKNRNYTIDFDSFERNLRHLEHLSYTYDKELEDLWNALQNFRDPEQQVIDQKNLDELISMCEDIARNIAEFYETLKAIEVDLEHYGSSQRSKDSIEKIEEMVVEAFEYLDYAHELSDKIRVFLKFNLQDSNLTYKIEQVMGYISQIEEDFEPIEFTNEATGETGYIGPEGIYFED